MDRRTPRFTFGTNVTRSMIRKSKHEPKATHPRVAGFLANVGRWFADGAQFDVGSPLTNNRNEIIFLVLFIAALFGAPAIRVAYLGWQEARAAHVDEYTMGLVRDCRVQQRLPYVIRSGDGKVLAFQCFDVWNNAPFHGQAWERVR